MRLFSWFLLLLLSCASLAQQFPLQTRPERFFPPRAVLVSLYFANDVAYVNGVKVTLAPGLRVFDLDNFIMQRGQLPKQAVQALAIADLYGNLLQAWILRPEEIRARQRANANQPAGTPSQ